MSILNVAKLTVTKGLTSVGDVFDIATDGITMASAAIRKHRDNQINNYDADVKRLSISSRASIAREVTETYAEIDKFNSNPENLKHWTKALEALGFDDYLNNI
jgi:hypothetical protein